MDHHEPTSTGEETKKVVKTKKKTDAERLAEFVSAMHLVLRSDAVKYRNRGARYYVDVSFIKGKFPTAPGGLVEIGDELARWFLTVAYLSDDIHVSHRQVAVLVEHAEAVAMNTAEPFVLDTRAYEEGDVLWINPAWVGGGLIRIKGGEWEIVGDERRLFEPRTARAAMAKPVRTERLFPELLQEALMHYEEWHPVICASCATMMMPNDTVHPFILLTGNQSKGKSTTMECLISLIDPYEGGELITLGEDKRDAISACTTRHCLGLDNISNSPIDEDLFAKFFSGGVVMTRKMATNADIHEVYVPKMRVFMNGIAPNFNQSDMIGRCLIIEHPTGWRDDLKAQREVKQHFERAKPELLGSLLNALAVAHGRWVEMGRETGSTAKNRFVEYTLFGELVSQAMGFEVNEFTKMIDEAVAGAKQTAVEADDCALLTTDWFNGDRPKAGGSFSGWESELPSTPKFPKASEYEISSNDLYSEIVDLAKSRKNDIYHMRWLGSGKAFSSAIRKSQYNIETRGWKITKVRKNDGVYYKINKV